AAFIAALSHEPEVLLLDEPTSGVDALGCASLWDTIRSQSERGVGVLVTTHNMQEAEQCARLLRMSSGRLAARAARPTSLARRPLSPCGPATGQRRSRR